MPGVVWLPPPFGAPAPSGTLPVLPVVFVVPPLAVPPVPPAGVVVPWLPPFAARLIESVACETLEALPTPPLPLEPVRPFPPLPTVWLKEVPQSDGEMVRVFFE
jgi:hypothetical protein